MNPDLGPLVHIAPISEIWFVKTGLHINYELAVEGFLKHF